MIAMLTGAVAEKLPNEVVLDVNGVGYGLVMISEDYGQLAQAQRVKLYVHEHIREQAHDLFGFLSLDTKQLFEQLLDVNGVGPKVAISVLSVGTANEVRQAIATGDTKFIQRAAGVGRRVAERIVVELKDKVGFEGVGLSTVGMLQSDALLMKDEAVEALVALGFTPADAAKALQDVDAKLPAEERVKLALRGNR